MFAYGFKDGHISTVVPAYCEHATVTEHAAAAVMNAPLVRCRNLPPHTAAPPAFEKRKLSSKNKRCSNVMGPD